jgi:hypothetical protein
MVSAPASASGVVVPVAHAGGRYLPDRSCMINCASDTVIRQEITSSFVSVWGSIDGIDTLLMSRMMAHVITESGAVCWRT